jgi:hypothetical protein
MFTAVAEGSRLRRTGIATPVALRVAVHADGDVVGQVGAALQKLRRRSYLQVARGCRLRERREQVAHAPHGQNHDGGNDDENPLQDDFHDA